MASIVGVVYRGADATIRLFIKNEDDSPRNVGSDSIRFTVKRTPQDETPLVTKTDDDGITKTDAAQGVVEVRLQDTDLLSVDHSTILITATRVTDATGYDSVTPLDLRFVVTADG